MRKAWIICLLLPGSLLLGSGPGAIWGKTSPLHAAGHPTGGSAPTLRNGPTSRRELERFVDGYFAKHLKALHVPGAEFVLVKNGKLFFAKGYGYANLARQTPVVPNRTIFRLCSVSKVFTATAIMQLVERGKLHLDDDVNRYLTLFKVPQTFSQPVTVADLLVHTGGFDERHISRSTLDVGRLQPLGAYLAQELPPPVTPPGRIYSYSDFGYALAGYLVQVASGMPFARYVSQHIFRPLGMRHSSFQQPLSQRLAANLATGYDVSDGGNIRPAPIEYFNTAPAAAMVGTGTDVGRFMIAQLGGGGYGHAHILSARAVREMQQQHFSSYPAGYNTPSVAYGFGISYWNGRRMLDHSGALRGFTSLITLLPAEHLGFFIAGTTAHDSFLFDLRRQFMDHFYPPAKPAAKLVTPAKLRGGLGRFTGSYWSHEYARLTIEKMRQLVNQVQVTANGNSTLIAHFWDGRVARVVRIAPLVFGSIDDRNVSVWAFQLDAAGNITHLVPGGYEVYDKIQWYETTQTQVIFIVCIVVLTLTGCWIWLVLPLVRRLRTSSGRPFGRTAAFAAWLMGIDSILTLIFLIGLAGSLLSAASTQAEHYSWLEYGVPAALIMLLCIPLVTTGMTVLLVIFAILAWQGRYWSLPARLHYTLVTCAAVLFVPLLLYWNLLGFRF